MPRVHWRQMPFSEVASLLCSPFLACRVSIYIQMEVDYNLVESLTFIAAVYEKLGYRWATSLLAFLTVLMLPMPYVFTSFHRLRSERFSESIVLMRAGIYFSNLGIVYVQPAASHRQLQRSIFVFYAFLPPDITWAYSVIRDAPRFLEGSTKLLF